MSATELMELLEQAQREGLGEEPIDVTSEQSERLHALVDGQAVIVRNATTVLQDGRLLLVRG